MHDCLCDCLGSMGRWHGFCTLYARVMDGPMGWIERAQLAKHLRAQAVMHLTQPQPLRGTRAWSAGLETRRRLKPALFGHRWHGRQVKPGWYDPVLRDSITISQRAKLESQSQRAACINLDAPSGAGSVPCIRSRPVLSIGSSSCPPLTVPRRSPDRCPDRGTAA